MHDLQMKDIMTRSFETLKAADNLMEAAARLRRTRLDALPVVSDDGELIGMLTKANLFDAVAEGQPMQTPVAELCERDVMTMSAGMSYEEIAEVVRSSHAGNAVALDAQGKLAGLFTKTDWIMAMFRREAALNIRLTAMLDTMHNGLVAVDAAGRVGMTNRAAVRILGLGEGQWQGRPLAAILPGLDITPVLAGAGPLIGIRHTQGDVTLLCSITPLLRDEDIEGAIIVFQDISDLHRVVQQLESVNQINETLQSVMDLAYDGLLVVDEYGLLTMVNRAAARFFRRSEKEMLGRPVSDVIDNTRLEEVLASGVQEINQLQFIRGVPFVVSRLPILRDGKVVGAVGKILFRNLDELRDIALRFAKGEYELPADDPAAPTGFTRIITADAAFSRVLEEAEIAARGSSNILITGESGTGKELVAQAIHRHSACQRGPMVKVNCAAIPDSLMEAEFFGYAPGAFTGARRSGRPGKLASADGGTLFLDEIGDLPLFLQGKLLRVLQDRRFEPIGSDESVQVNVRFIAATNQDLRALIAQGLFREDLFYRLNVVQLQIPPLRSRPHDIMLLAHFFLEKYNQRFGADIGDISPVVEQILVHHPWPGNVRELENVIERAINFARDRVIGPPDLPAYLRQAPPAPPAVPPAAGRPLRSTRDDHEREMIVQALERAGGNKAKAARLLGISRSWLYEKIARNGL